MISPHTRTRSTNLASTVSTTEHATNQLVLVRLGNGTYGIDLSTVREIIPLRATTRLPGAPAAVLGLMNVRGTIVTVFDLGVVLGATAPGRVRGSVVLVEHGTKLVGVAVDQVSDVRRLADVEVGASQEDVAPGGSVRALGRLDGEVIALLDIHDLISQVLA